MEDEGRESCDGLRAENVAEESVDWLEILPSRASLRGEAEEIERLLVCEEPF